MVILIIKTMQINLNNKFYSKDAILETIAAFNSICDAKIIDDYYTVEILSTENNETIVNEFKNYVLGTMKNRSLV